MQTGTFPGEQRPGFVYLPPRFSRSHPLIPRRSTCCTACRARRPSISLGTVAADLGGHRDRAVGRSHPVHRRAARQPAPIPSTTANGPGQSQLGPRARKIAPVGRQAPADDCHGARGTRDCWAVGRRLRSGRHRPTTSRLSSGRSRRGSAYFSPLRDGPLRHAPQSVLAANDPTELVPAPISPPCPALGITCASSSRPDRATATGSSSEGDLRVRARAARARCGRSSYHVYWGTHAGEWRVQLNTGLGWAFPLG